MRRVRALVPVAAATVLLAIGPIRAAAEEGTEVTCDGIGRVQTYHGWGPALHYGTTVTVAFSSGDCGADLNSETFSFDLNGTATVYEGTEAAGEPFDVQPFVSEGSWTGDGASGWPPPWWSCDVQDASLRWEIPGVYSFVVSATGGSWKLNVSPGDVDWTHNSC